jgi:hypothetical protein
MEWPFLAKYPICRPWNLVQLFPAFALILAVDFQEIPGVLEGVCLRNVKIQGALNSWHYNRQFKKVNPSIFETAPTHKENTHINP